jgi:dolichol-phosphate mannosyltransferase
MQAEYVPPGAFSITRILYDGGGDWYADPSRAAELLDWQAQIDFRSGLTATSTWYLGLDEGEQKRFRDETKQAVQPNTRYSVSAVVACYKDGEAIPIL